ncbi:hypothetical protein SD209_11025 [Pseudomonas aeruginosa]|nr:hypothetical protein [Pseudomonas aeruginosa]WPD47126.1 hypothetical protein SD209_11025 [Pseudomonas aeruginosa]
MTRQSDIFAAGAQRQQPKPGRRHPWNRPTCDFAQVAVSQQVQP